MTYSISAAPARGLAVCRLLPDDRSLRKNSHPVLNHSRRKRAGGHIRCRPQRTGVYSRIARPSW